MRFTNVSINVRCYVSVKLADVSITWLAEQFNSIQLNRPDRETRQTGLLGSKVCCDAQQGFLLGEGQQGSLMLSKGLPMQCLASLAGA